MAISSAGIGSGLDVDSIVTKLMDIEKAPLNALKTKATVIDTKISAFGTIKSQLSALNDAVNRLSLASTWDAKTVTSSNSTAVSAIAASSSSAAISVSVEVSQLARPQSTSSAAVATGSGFRAGTLSIQLGGWSSGATPAFTAGSGPAVSVAVAEGDSMSAIATKINAAGAGVTATVLKDANGERLLMRSSSTGELQGFRVQSTDSGTGTAASLSGLSFDNPAAGVGMAANTVQYGLNAKATINGVAISTASNTLADNVPGLTLTLSQVTTAPVEIAVATDTSSQSAAINAFVSAYNATNQMFNSATSYDATTKSAALLQGDSTTTGLQSSLRQLVGNLSGGGTMQRLSDLGISVAKDGSGSLAVDAAKLNTALQNSAAVRQFFVGAASTGATTPPTAGVTNANNTSTGFASRLNSFLTATVGSSGILATKTTSLQSQKTLNGKDQDTVNLRLSNSEARLRRQYSALDSQVSSLTALNTYITQQIAQWNKSTD